MMAFLGEIIQICGASLEDLYPPEDPNSSFRVFMEEVEEVIAEEIRKEVEDDAIS